MTNSFLIAFVSTDESSNGVVYDSYTRFKNEVLLGDKRYTINRLVVKPNEIDYLTGNSPAIVIYDKVKEHEIDEAKIRKIKSIYPLAHFVFFTEKYDKNEFLNVLKKGFEFCVSSEFFDEELFKQTLINIFYKVVSVTKINNVIISGNNISMNLIDRKVWCSGNEIEVTKNEFDILKFFLDHPNVFYGKEEIFKKVWGFDDDSTGLVIQYIYKLKKKIGKENIVSSTHNGYCFKLREKSFS